MGICVGRGSVAARQQSRRRLTRRQLARGHEVAPTGRAKEKEAETERVTTRNKAKVQTFKREKKRYCDLTCKSQNTHI